MVYGVGKGVQVSSVEGVLIEGSTLLVTAMSSEQQAVMVDMEEGVVSELLGGPLGEVFDSQQLLTDVSGSGNNWLTHTPSLYIHSFSHHNSFFTKKNKFCKKVSIMLL